MQLSAPWPDYQQNALMREPMRNLLIRRLRQVVQDRLLPSVRWADIPQLFTRDKRCPASWQQHWQQSRPNGTDPRPSANECRTYPELAAQRASVLRCCRVADASRWPLLLLSPLLSAQISRERWLVPWCAIQRPGSPPQTLVNRGTSGNPITYRHSDFDESLPGLARQRSRSASDNSSDAVARMSTSGSTLVRSPLWRAPISLTTVAS